MDLRIKKPSRRLMQTAPKHATTHPVAGSPDMADSGVKDWGEREFQVKKYKLKFKPELFGAQAGFNTFYGVSSLIMLSMSDVMGDHRAHC